MPSPTTHAYRIHADHCVRQADHAKTAQHRMVLLQLAQAWLWMADEAEATNKVAVED